MAFFFLLQHAAAQPTPRQLFGDLFTAVQLQQIFPDQKTFVDCIPEEDPQKIMNEYDAEQANPSFSLKKFVGDHFILPETNSTPYSSDISAGVIPHINELWNVLSRKPDSAKDSSSLLPLPYSYLVPGGRFREIYYWDSYFTMLGLKESRDTSMIENMVKNFSYLILHDGFIPNGNRTYYLSRSQPPFFSLMVDLLAELKGNEIYREYLPSLAKEYQYWMNGTDHLAKGEAKFNAVNIEGEILNRYFDYSTEPREESFIQDVKAAKESQQPADTFYRNVRAAAESGWDFSSRWFDDEKNLSTIHTTDIIPIDLNCLLWHLEETLAKAYQLNHDVSKADVYAKKAFARQKAIQHYCWNDQLKFFCDYDFRKKESTSELTLAGMFPLYFHLATPAESKDEASLIQQKFLKEGGVITTVKNSGEQWDEPNGWAPLEYISIEGLNAYDFDSLAKKIATRWIELNVQVFKNTGKLLEKYNVENLHLAGGGGEYLLQDGFGWTNGVLLKLIDEYPIKGIH